MINANLPTPLGIEAGLGVTSYETSTRTASAFPAASATSWRRRSSRLARSAGSPIRASPRMTRLRRRSRSRSDSAPARRFPLEQATRSRCRAHHSCYTCGGARKGSTPKAMSNSALRSVPRWARIASTAVHSDAHFAGRQRDGLRHQHGLPARTLIAPCFRRLMGDRKSVV